jgi:hypothetical protein
VFISTQQNTSIDVFLTVHHGMLMNQHEFDTLSLACLLTVSASTCFGRYSPIFRRLCQDATWCNYVRRMCVDCVQVAVEPQTERRNLHNEELNDLYSASNIFWVIKPRRMRWAGIVARMGERRVVYRVLVGTPEGKGPLGSPRRR